MAIITGKGGAVKLGTSTETTVLGVSSWTLSSDADEIDVTSLGDTDKAYLAGFKSHKCSFKGFYDPADANGQAALHTAFDSGAEVHVNLYTNVTATEGWEGDAIVLSREVETSVDGAVTCSFELRFNGAPVAL